MFCVPISSLLSQQECQDLIHLADYSIGFTSQEFPLNSYASIDVPQSSPTAALLEQLFQKILPQLPSTLLHLQQEYVPFSLNTRLRFSKYEHERKSDIHQDKYFENGIFRTFYTVCMYLNDNFSGGATTFFDSASNTKESFHITPKQGSVLIFDHLAFHEGSTVYVNKGQQPKIICRSDVIFKRVDFLT